MIDAVNSDMPYDEFVREQIAGDLLAAQTPAQTPADKNRDVTATGFLALGSLDLGEQNNMQYILDAVDEQINAASRAFMGVTVGCARCHDHKFDPDPAPSDYYALAGDLSAAPTRSTACSRRPRDNSSYFNVRLAVEVAARCGASFPNFPTADAKASERKIRQVSRSAGRRVEQ